MLMQSPDRDPAPDTRNNAKSAPGIVLSYAPGERFSAANHECVTRMKIARQLAALKGYEFGGEYDPAASYARPLYLVPSCTIVGRDTTDALGITSERDLFGGVVPHALVGTKSITHPLIDERALAPRGWSPQFAHDVAHAVLSGFSAFSAQDAQRAGERLLEHGAVRVKPALAVGGRGQTVVASAGELRAAVAAMPAAELASHGVVLEQNLNDVTTYSVGQVIVDDLVVTYWGTQALTTDNNGAQVYGGSELIVARGDFDALLELDLTADARHGVEQARVYDDAASRCFPGFFASRRNYDTVHGRDDAGRRCSGVLEQSWRIGGASTAEIGALALFEADRRVIAARARTVELYGGKRIVPPDAIVYFDGLDEDVGLITKYMQVEVYAHA
jgi:hypothetical protein